MTVTDKYPQKLLREVFFIKLQEIALKIYYFITKFPVCCGGSGMIRAMCNGICTFVWGPA
jgi:hypothetical protein